jgi:hypothetical protein
MLSPRLAAQSAAREGSQGRYGLIERLETGERDNPTAPPRRPHIVIIEP